MSRPDRSHEPAFATTAKQPTLSVAIAIGSSPTLIPFLPGVSGLASSTLTSPPANPVEGLVANWAIATVPGPPWRMKPYQAEPGIGAPPMSVRFSWPAGCGSGAPLSRGPERMVHASSGCAVTVTSCAGVASAPPVSRRPP